MSVSLFHGGTKPAEIARLAIETARNNPLRKEDKGMLMGPEELRGYLDFAIRAWRRRKQEAGNSLSKYAAACYVDAYQSVRVSVFGELLPLDE